MNLQAYIKGSKRGNFQWECTESGNYGDGNSVDVEQASLKGKVASITRQSGDCFEAEVDSLNFEPFYDEREFSSRLNARKWCERMIQNDIKKE